MRPAPGADHPADTRSARSEPTHSAGIAPDPAALADCAIVQVYAASTYGWKGWFAIHPWLVYKRSGETAYTRVEVVGRSGSEVVKRNYALPDGLWYGATPVLLREQRGAAAEALIPALEAAVASYPHARQYRSWPGPNSNTFVAHLAREVAALRLDLPANAVGKDYRPLLRPIGISASGSGLQVSLLGLIGLSAGMREGVELNLLGLHFGIDLLRPALRLPLIGRLGLSRAGPRVLHPGHGAALVPVAKQSDPLHHGGPSSQP